MPHELTTRDLTDDTWDDFVSVLGSNGGARGCWCMHWRLSIAEWTEGMGDGNRQAMKKLSRRKPAPGVVVYDGSTPVAWCSLGPRNAFARLDRSPLLKPVDDEHVCSIACVFVARRYRKNGLLPSILDAVCDYAAAHDYPTVEGYPVDPPDGRRAGSDTAMTGIASAFREAGFTEVARPRKDRPIMRRVVN